MRRRQNKGSAAQPRIKSFSQWIWACAALVSIALVCFGALRALRMVTCGAWPAVEGIIETSELKRGMMREGSLKYNHHIVYRYTVGPDAYTSDRISFAGSSRSGRNRQNILKTYPKGKSVTVRHHPTKPDLAVLEVDRPWSGYRALLMGLLVTPLTVLGFWRRWPLQTDYLFREQDPDAPLTWKHKALGAAGMLTCLAIAWIWWELIKQYAGR